MASVSVIAQVTARLLALNVAAISRSTNIMMKKSNASARSQFCFDASPEQPG